MTEKYDHFYQDKSVYGHVVHLIKQHGTLNGLHIDIACGYAAIAEPLSELGLHYVGFEIDEAALQKLKLRGFEASLIDLSMPETAVQTIMAIVGDRAIASISIIDALEHIVGGEELLRQLRVAVSCFDPLLVVSVPNVGHRDIAMKLLFGRWDYTTAGLLDQTHLVHHTNRHLSSITLRAGWSQVDEANFHLTRSDQHFPKHHPLLSYSTAIGEYLNDLRSNADEFFDVYQHVRAYRIAEPRLEVKVLHDQYIENIPFLSVITRTQGKRIRNLREVVLCLCSQTDQDFELVVVAHKVTATELDAIKSLLNELPGQVKQKAKLIQCDVGTRAAPLNAGFKMASGQYIAILDDDDYVFAHWIEIFRKLADEAPGRVLRSVACEQAITSTGENSEAVSKFRTIGPIVCSFPSDYDLFAHLKQNFSPVFSLAFPRYAFESMGIHFDETLNSAEDWDFQMRTVLLCGVWHSPEITGIYRKWQSGESSFSIHSEKTWREDYEKIIAKLDGKSHLFPPGTISRIINSQPVHPQKNTLLLLELALKKNTLHYVNRFIVRPSHQFFLKIPFLYPFAKRIYRWALQCIKLLSK